VPQTGVIHGDVVQRARPRPFPAGTDLFQQGFAADEVLLLEEGVVKLIRIEEDGRQLIVSLRSPISILGAAAAVTDEAHTATARTVTACTVRHVPAQAFRELLKTDPAASWQVHEMLSREVCEQAARLSQIACCSSRQRLELALRGLMPEAAGSAKDVKLQTPLKHREIAELIAVTPEQLSRLLREMEQEGLLRREKGWLILRDIRTWSGAGEPSPMRKPAALRTEWVPGRLTAIKHRLDRAQ
jgi:CRP/FNR family transcriptional regulator